MILKSNFSKEFRVNPNINMNTNIINVSIRKRTFTDALNYHLSKKMKELNINSIFFLNQDGSVYEPFKGAYCTVL